jgi:uncharacterized membrane protein YphA (DoxX/SURF4 family)
VRRQRLVNKRAWYIISAENKLLVAYKILIFTITVPHMMLNLYLVTFGQNLAASKHYQTASYIEILYGIDLVLGFLTTFVDKEQVVQS